MTKVETKLWCVIALLGALIVILTVITLKLLNTQTLMLVGERGLHAVSEEARGDIQVIRKAAHGPAGAGLFRKRRARIVSQDTSTIPGKVITHYLKGGEMWATTNNIVTINRNIDRPVKYSKLKLINAAKAAGKWADVKAAIKAMDLEDEWQACQYITSDYPAYVAATNTVITRGIATEAEVKAFMRQAEDN